jgi:hypothetical protein
MQSSEKIQCPGCGELIPIHADIVGSSLGCSHCLAILDVEKVDLVDDDDTGLEEVGEDVVSSEEIIIPQAADGVRIAPALDLRLRRKEAGDRFRTAVIVVLAACLAGVGGLLYDANSRLAVLEGARHEARMAIAAAENRSVDREASRDAANQELIEKLGSLDQAVETLAIELKKANPTTLQNSYALQGTARNLMRHEEKLGLLAMQLFSLKAAVYDKNKQALQAHELDVKKRKATDEAAKPIRERIRKLEDQKNVLVSRYRTLSIPRRPQGVVSKSRASALLEEWNGRAAPVLAQLEAEIENIRGSIDAEESRIDDLYKSVTGYSEMGGDQENPTTPGEIQIE